MTADVLRAPRRVTPSSTRNQRTCTRRRHDKPCKRSGDASFTRSEDPCTSILTMHRAKARWWGADDGIAVGQTRTSGNNQHRGHHERTERGSPRVHRSRKGGGMARQRRKEVEASVPARIKSSGLVARASLYVAEVGRRRLVSNKLGKRAPKRAAGSSEQGPSYSRPAAGETAGGCRSAKRSSS